MSFFFFLANRLFITPYKKKVKMKKKKKKLYTVKYSRTRILKL